MTAQRKPYMRLTTKRLLMYFERTCAERVALKLLGKQHHYVDLHYRQIAGELQRRGIKAP